MRMSDYITTQHFIQPLSGPKLPNIELKTLHGEPGNDARHSVVWLVAHSLITLGYQAPPLFLCVLKRLGSLGMRLTY